MSKLSRCLIIALALVLVFTYSFPEGVVYAEGDIVASGTCGDNLTWELDSDGVLTISGTGEMDDFIVDDSPSGYVNSVPWFSYRRSIKSIIIGEEVTSIGNWAFINCEALSEIVFPENMARIGNYAFNGCTSLTSITIPEGITTIGDGTFYYCTSLSSIVIPDGIISIGEGAFTGCSSLTNITIPNSVTSIGEVAFRGCSSLNSIEIPNSVRSIGKSAFSGCSSLKSMTLPFLGQSATENCFLGFIFGASSGSQNASFVPSSLKKVIITDGMTFIENFAFGYCENLETIVIPDGVTSINLGAFYCCYGLKHVNIPESVTSIGNSAFDNCSSLATVTLPEGLKSINQFAFSGCTSLTSVIIPEGVTSIGRCAFQFCYQLSAIYIPETVVECGEGNVFDGNTNTTVYTTPGSYVATHKPSNCTISYLCDSVAENGNAKHLGFSTDTIVMKNGRVLNIFDYLINNTCSDDCCVVTLSNVNDFGYNYPNIYCLHAGECDVTVTNGDFSATVKIIARDDNPVAIETITLHDKSLSMVKGEMVVNTATLNPINADNTDISWSSSDESVSTVSNGLITAVGAGTTTITVYSSSNPDIKAECQVTVTIPLYDIIPLEDPMIMDKETSRKVLFYRYHYGATDEITFASADPDIASIDDVGRVTANNIGTTTVTISSGDIVKTVEVRVIKALKGISLDKTSGTLYNGDSLQLNVIFDPEDTTETDNVTWSSSNEVVATVDENGLVTAHGMGIVDITATVGNYSATCNVVCPRVALTGIVLPATIELEYGQEHTMEITGVPANTTDYLTATWISRDESILTVDSNGVITPQGIGTTKVVAMVGDFVATTDVTIVKGRPNYVVPTGITATCKQTLSEVSLPNGFTWTDDTINVGTAGSKEYSVVFIPEDTEHYVIVYDIPVTVEVAHRFAEAWLSDETQHWHECVCGEKAFIERHTWGDWVVVETPDCVNGGSQQRTCDVCGTTEDQKLDPNGHTWAEEVTVDQAPDCTTDGSQSRHCLYCDQKTDVTTLPALGHDWDTENVVWNWFEDYSSAEATFTCRRDHSHTETLTGVVTSETVSGIITYTASVVLEGATYTDTKTVDAHAIIRVFGKSRYLTAIEAADHLKEKKGSTAFDNIIIASGSGFPDALSASYLAYRKDAPILLVHSSVFTIVADYINANLAPGGTVYIVGGEGVVSPEVEQLINGTVKRLAGKDRYETNIKVLEEAGLEFNDSENVLVACGTNFADALSASAVGEPILLVGKEMNAKQEAFLKSFLPGEGESGFQNYEFSIIGGSGAVPEKVESQLKALGSVERVYGSNRYQTSIAVAERFFEGDQDTVVIANGNNFPDGLSGGPVATAYGAPLILLVDKVNDHAVQYFKDKNAYRLIIMGGEGVISNETAEKVFKGTV